MRYALCYRSGRPQARPFFAGGKVARSSLTSLLSSVPQLVLQVGDPLTGCIDFPVAVLDRIAESVKLVLQIFDPANPLGIVLGVLGTGVVRELMAPAARTPVFVGEGVGDGVLIGVPAGVVRSFGGGSVGVGPVGEASIGLLLPIYGGSVIVIPGCESHMFPPFGQLLVTTRLLTHWLFRL